MEEEKLLEYVDQQRWLLNNGLFNDSAKNQLFTYGRIHEGTRAVEVNIAHEKKMVSYKIYVETYVLRDIKQYFKLSKSTSWFGLWRFKRFLQKNGTLDFQQMLDSCVKGFCGPRWKAEVQVFDIAAYKEGIEVEDDSETSRQSDKLSNG